MSCWLWTAIRKDVKRTAAIWKRYSPMFDAVFEVLGTGLWATKQLISAVRGHLNQTKPIPLWLFGWRWPAVLAGLGSGAESTSDTDCCRWWCRFRWDGGFGPPVTMGAQDNRRGFRNQANRLAGFLLRSPGRYLENRSRLGLL